MDKHKQINESILLGYFTGTLSIPLQQEVEDWISASEENKKIARDIQSICLATETLTCIRQTDSGTALKKVKSKIHSHRKISLSAWIQRIAAILILPLIIFSGYLFYQHQKEENIVWIEKSAGYGDIKHITLPDNTTVWLNAGSTIIYPEEFIGRFRQIFFTGEGHFSVAKNKEKPFIIKSNESSIEVLGTQFNLKSYSNDNRIEVALLDGSVAFCYPSTTDQEMKCILSPGEQVYYNRTTHNLEKKNFILSDYSSWKDGKYYFKNETIKLDGKIIEIY